MIIKNIQQLVSSNGYITIDDFMRISMNMLDASYYRHHNPIGCDKDFITAPEVSQMFGEMMGLWAIDMWHILGEPKKLNIIELGSGTGALMRDLLRTAKLCNGFNDALMVYLLDINPHLIKQQHHTIEDTCSDMLHKVKWISNLDDDITSCAPSLIIANEFFDALPIKQYIKSPSGFREIVIKDIEDSDRFIFDHIAISDNLSQELYEKYPGAKDGGIVEISCDAEYYIKQIANYMSNGGYALIIDYGYNINPATRKDSEYNATLQAIKNHKYCDIFDFIGDSDLTAHVDFNALSILARKYHLNHQYIITQDAFLHKFGIDIRKYHLQKQNPQLSTIIENQYQRLTSQNHMGHLFYAMSVSN